MIKKGNKRQLNTLIGVSEMISITNKEIEAISRPLGKNIPIYNKDTQEIKISDGVSIPKNLPDHKHPFTYAPIVHSHMFGANEPWLMSNPRLWWKNDVTDHPELVVLDGSEISEERAVHLKQIYPGVKVLTTPITESSGSGFENDDLTLTASQFHGFNHAGRIFGDELSISNFADIDDQWLTGTTNINDEHTLTIVFKKGFAYRPTQYVIIPAGGTAEKILEDRPTPRHIFFEGSNDGTTWELIDEQTNIEGWSTCTPKSFDIVEEEGVELKDYQQFRIRISEWNPCDNPALFGGIRRLWIFGHKANTFALPKMDCEHPDFCWVVPIQDINVGLIHENIGDIGYTAVLRSLIPAYRLRADGSALSKTLAENRALYATIGHEYDKEFNNFTMVDQNGTTIESSNFAPTITNLNEASFFELVLEDPTTCIGVYKFNITDKRIPKSWTVEVFDGTVWHAIQHIEECPESTFIEQDGIFQIDTANTDIPATKLRINILGWHEGIPPFGIDGIKLFNHPNGYFYIPNIPATDNCIPYIVRNINGHDVTPQVLARLQQNIMELAHSHAAMITRINNIDPSMLKPIPPEEIILDDPDAGF